MMTQTCPEKAAMYSKLKQQILRFLPETGDYRTAIAPLGLYRRDQVRTDENCFNQPLVSIIVQGRKRSIIGREMHQYGEGDYLITSVDMPTINSITHASENAPFLSLALYLDPTIMAELLYECPALAQGESAPFSGIAINQVDIDILHAFQQLIELLDKPAQIPILAPLKLKEIHYLLLLGAFGQPLRALHTQGSKINQIAKSIDWLKLHFSEAMSIEALAGQVNMAASTFHRHFKQVTTLSPLQYQKQLRLHEARRLMLSANYNATQAGLAVGYESSTQFNREYKRLFGYSPLRDIARIR